MITLKSPHEIEAMRRAGRLTSAARALAGAMIRPGITTQEIDRAVHDFICAQGAVPSFELQRVSGQRLCVGER